MKKPEGDGIICDYCGCQAHTDFTYYSLDFARVQVNNKVRTQGPVIASIDFCDTCMNLYRDRVKQAYLPPVPNRFTCDVSGEIVITPTFIYYRCLISKVEVNLSDAPFACTTCQQARALDDKPCEKCTPESKIVRSADPKVDDKYLELNFSAVMFDKFQAHLEHMKTGATEWSEIKPLPGL